MRAKRTIISLLIVLALWHGAPIGATVSASADEAGVAGAVVVAGEGRSVYIGDIITLEVTARGLSAEDVEERLHAFEIVDFIAEGDGYLISIRTFEPGEQRIILGDKEIVIDVRSTLDDIARDDIFEADISVIESGFIFHWRLLFYIALGMLALSGGFVLWKAIKKRSGERQSPIQLFLRRSARLSSGDDNYFVDLTFYFKEYLEALYGRRIIGKTSDEIIGELEAIEPLGAMLPEMRGWLAECDRLKFTGVTVAAEVKEGHCGKLLDLAQRIDARANSGVGAEVA